MVSIPFASRFLKTEAMQSFPMDFRPSLHQVNYCMKLIGGTNVDSLSGLDHEVRLTD